MAEHNVFGQFRVPVEDKPAARRIGDPNKFWKDVQDHKNKKVRSLANKCGVYVFGMRAAGGIVPYYIGKTTKSFEKECFQVHKLDKYNDALSEYKKGTPVMFFIVSPKPAAKDGEIRLIEDFLIQLGVARNEKLLNFRGIAKPPSWSIKGVIRHKGKPPKSAQEFKRMMNIQ